MAGPTLLADLADEILTAVQTVFAAAAVALPDRRYVTTGAVAWDCDSVVVSFTRLYSGLPQGESPGPELAPQGKMRSADFGIWLIRCVPSLGDKGSRTWPTSTRLTDAAHITMVDTLTLFYGLRNAYADGTFLTPCESASFGPIQAVGPEGMYAGITMNLGVQL